MSASAAASPLAMAAAVLPGTPQQVIDAYATLAARAETRSFGLIEDDVVVLDTETTGLSHRENELIEIAAARLRGREIVDRFDTFVKPSGLIPAEITELTSITNVDVAHAPSAEGAVAALTEFVGGAPVIAHNSAFDRGFIEAVSGGSEVSDIWIDSLALSRIALPRLSSHKLASMAELFGCASVSHRANADVEALCGVWRILLCGLDDLPLGLMRRLADMHPDVPWSYRPIFSFLAGSHPDAVFSMVSARHDILAADSSSAAGSSARIDADELPGLNLPSREEVEACFEPDGLVNRMYPGYEPRVEQMQMAAEVRDALATSSHRVIEAGTGVGKSIAYLVPFAQAAKRNNITVGIATKSNNLADQLMYHELPRLAREIEGGLTYCALKGYDHYPCLRKLERLARASEVHTTRDPADTLTAIAVIYAYACQSPAGDLDGLGIRWRSVQKADLTTSSRECARRLCPFYPDKCMVHGSRRRAARADVVVTNHSLLFRNVAADGKILPPIRHWVVDEAHSIEGEARRQWAVTVSADESRSIFERLGGARTGSLGRITRDLAASDAATLFMGLTAKATSSTQRASLAMADLFDAVRDLARSARSDSGYDTANMWIGREVRESAAWGVFAEVANTAIDALDEASKNLASLVETVAEEKPELVADVADGQRRLKELNDGLKLVVEGTNDRYVYSCQVNRRIKAGGESLSAERLDIGEALAENWLPEMHTAIFASATMTVSGSFDHFTHAVGLDRLGRESFQTLHLDSSYDFERNMAVVVAGDIPDPRNRAAYLDALENLLVDVHMAMGGSTLTLFTNRRDMEELFDRVSPRLSKEGLALDCQKKNTSAKILRDRFLSDETSSLFALKAFWEGFDAAGDTLRCVVIPKLPFSSPTDPLSCERGVREDRAWARYSLPEAVLEVKQAAGRLIRTSTDAGVLVLADSRLVTKGYGKKFLSSLPAAYQRIESPQVGRYLELWRASHR
ncbi:helicase C-terminal domain-containing protein [Collinsella sp. AF08-23]|uniref:helicase C-terminal domain-containing protein n=1 Tax=Collinsella sp. AF08-23 TaxID=2292211 RepID=UPI000E5059BF|nr:helicase C-terminal domain-containing protein [Collinsella sp. AF08-23]RHS39304.1 DNA polymerase III subunit epsilon [Collinsella sp. AF08-23]